MANGQFGDCSKLVNFLKSAIIALFVSIPCFSSTQNIVVNQFSGLDTQDPPSALQPNQSQDLLNVRLQPGGRSVYKRDGYGLFQALNAISSATVHGGYHFQQTSGSDVQLWGSDSGLYASVQDGQFVRVATGTLGSTWQCTDNLGFAYCVTSSGIDTPVKTDGTIANTTYQTGIPDGTIVASTPLQLVVAGVSGNASSVYVSSNNAFSSFGSGPLPTDPYIEIINSPGSRITHMAYYFGNIYWWKDQSFGYISGSASQGTVGVTIVSNQIGTLDDSSAFWNPTNYDTGNHFGTQAQAGSPVSSGNPYFNELSQLGGIFFRGQDNHIYQYDGYNLTRLSRMITPNITASATRKANFWTQTTQSDFQNGSIVPAGHLTLTQSPGDVTISTFQAVENSSTQWNAGTSSNLTISPSSFTLATNNLGSINDPSFENAQSDGFGGFLVGPDWNAPQVSGSQWIALKTEATSHCGTVNPQSGTYFSGGSSLGTNANSPYFKVQIVDANLNVLVSKTISTSAQCSWLQTSISSSGFIGRIFKLQFVTGSNTTGPLLLTSSASYVLSGDINFYYIVDNNGTSTTAPIFFIDNIQNGVSTISSGWILSQAYDTGISSQTIQIKSDFTALSSTPTFSVQTSTSTNGIWTTLLTSTGTNAIGNRYVRYSSSMSVVGGGISPVISTVTIIAASSGTYYSSVDNAPNLNVWNSFVANGQVNSGSLTYFTRSSTNVFSILSSTPSWISQTNNGNVAASTGTFFQARIDFATTSSTAVPILNDFTFNWFEGSASDKAYISYFQDAIWFSVSSGSSTSNNNTIFYLDLLNSAWLKDNIAANGFAVENNTFYFGDPLTSKIYKFGGFSADNNQSIQSYWKSMDFAGTDPTVQNQFVQSDFSFLESSNTVAYTYALDQSTSTTVFNIPLYSSKSSILKRGFLLPVGKIGTYYNFSVGDNSTSPKWTFIGHRVQYNPLNWLPQTSG